MNDVGASQPVSLSHPVAPASSAPQYTSPDPHFGKPSRCSSDASLVPVPSGRVTASAFTLQRTTPKSSPVNEMVYEEADWGLMWLATPPVTSKSLNSRPVTSSEKNTVA